MKHDRFFRGVAASLAITVFASGCVHWRTVEPSDLQSRVPLTGQTLRVESGGEVITARDADIARGVAVWTTAHGATRVLDLREADRVQVREHSMAGALVGMTAGAAGVVLLILAITAISSVGSSSGSGSGSSGGASESAFAPCCL